MGTETEWVIMYGDWNRMRRDRLIFFKQRCYSLILKWRYSSVGVYSPHWETVADSSKYWIQRTFSIDPNRDRQNNHYSFSYIWHLQFLDHHCFKNIFRDSNRLCILCCKDMFVVQYPLSYCYNTLLYWGAGIRAHGQANNESRCQLQYYTQNTPEWDYIQIGQKTSPAG